MKRAPAVAGVDAGVSNTAASKRVKVQPTDEGSIRQQTGGVGDVDDAQEVVDALVAMLRGGVSLEGQSTPAVAAAAAAVKVEPGVEQQQQQQQQQRSADTAPPPQLIKVKEERKDVITAQTTVVVAPAPPPHGAAALQALISELYPTTGGRGGAGEAASTTQRTAVSRPAAVAAPPAPTAAAAVRALISELYPTAIGDGAETAVAAAAAATSLAMPTSVKEEPGTATAVRRSVTKPASTPAPPPGGAAMQTLIHALYPTAGAGPGGAAAAAARATAAAVKPEPVPPGPPPLPRHPCVVQYGHCPFITCKWRGAPGELCVAHLRGVCRAANCVYAHAREEEYAAMPDAGASATPSRAAERRLGNLRSAVWCRKRDETREHVTVFSNYLLARDVAAHGAKQFAVTAAGLVPNIVLSTPAQHRHFYAVVPPTSPVDVYLDVDCALDGSATPPGIAAQKNELLASVLSTLVGELQAMGGQPSAAAAGIALESFLVLDATTAKKISFHIHAQLKGHVFASAAVLKEFVARAFPPSHPQHARVDLSVYSSFACYRLPFCTKLGRANALAPLDVAAVARDDLTTLAGKYQKTFHPRSTTGSEAGSGLQQDVLRYCLVAREGSPKARIERLAGAAAAAAATAAPSATAAAAAAAAAPSAQVAPPHTEPRGFLDALQPGRVGGGAGGGVGGLASISREPLPLDVYCGDIRAVPQVEDAVMRHKASKDAPPPSRFLWLGGSDAVPVAVDADTVDAAEWVERRRWCQQRTSAQQERSPARCFTLGRTPQPPALAAPPEYLQVPLYAVPNIALADASRRYHAVVLPEGQPVDFFLSLSCAEGFAAGGPLPQASPPAARLSVATGLSLATGISDLTVPPPPPPSQSVRTAPTLRLDLDDRGSRAHTTQREDAAARAQVSQVVSGALRGVFDACHAKALKIAKLLVLWRPWTASTGRGVDVRVHIRLADGVAFADLAAMETFATNAVGGAWGGATRAAVGGGVVLLPLPWSGFVPLAPYDVLGDDQLLATLSESTDAMRAMCNKYAGRHPLDVEDVCVLAAANRPDALPAAVITKDGTLVPQAAPVALGVAPMSSGGGGAIHIAPPPSGSSDDVRSALLAVVRALDVHYAALLPSGISYSVVGDDRQAYSVKITGSRYCLLLGREHKGTYPSLLVRRGGLYVRCWSNDCGKDATRFEWPPSAALLRTRLFE